MKVLIVDDERLARSELRRLLAAHPEAQIVGEAAMGAAHHRLSNLVCLVDINNQQADGPSGKIMGFEPLADKWAAFGWHVQRVDGNDMPAVIAAFDAARALKEDKPRVILFDTQIGRASCRERVL